MIGCMSLVHVMPLSASHANNALVLLFLIIQGTQFRHTPSPYYPSAPCTVDQSSVRSEGKEGGKKSGWSWKDLFGKKKKKKSKDTCSGSWDARISSTNGTTPTTAATWSHVERDSASSAPSWSALGAAESPYSARRSTFVVRGIKG